MDMTTMLMLMMMSKGGSNNNMMPLMLMMMMGGSGGSTGLSSLGIDQKAIQVALLPGVGSMGKMLLGGVGAVMAGKLMGGTTRRRRANTRTRTIYRNRYSNYRRRY